MKNLTRFMVLVLFCSFAVSGLVRAEEAGRPDLFCVSEVTLGKTNIVELLAVKKIKHDLSIETEGFLQLDSIKFGHKDQIFITLEIDKNSPMPIVWENAGFQWGLSYQSWVSLLEGLGFKLNIIQPPTIQVKEGQPVFEAEIEAFLPTEYPTVFTLSFKDNQGTGTASENVLRRITARYVPDFIGFTIDSQFINGESVLYSQSKRKALALTGLEAEIVGFNHEKLELELRNQAGIEKWKKVLAEEWGITKRTQLLEKIAWIETKGDSELFLELAQVLKEKNNKSLNQIGVELGYNDFQIKRLYLVNGKQKIVGERALRAWDYSRMALLCRIGYQVGFLSDNEAWTQLERILTQVESQYLSWEDYAANYTLGLFFWGLEFEMEFEKVNQTLQAYAKLTCSSGYVWELAWNRNAQNSQVYINTFEDVLFFPPVQYRAWKSYLNGWQCFESGEFGSALEYYQKGLALDPGFSELWLLIAMVYNAQMDYGKAIEILNDYLKEKPDEYLPRIYLAEIYEKINHIEEAIAEYNQAIDLDDTKPEGFVGLGRIGINSGDYDLAISYLRIAESLYLNEDENIYYTLYLLGYSYYKTEKFDKALSFLLRASPKFQDDDMYLNYYLGVCYLYEQNINLASTYLARAEELGLTIPKEVKGLLTETNGP